MEKESMNLQKSEKNRKNTCKNVIKVEKIT